MGFLLRACIVLKSLSSHLAYVKRFVVLYGPISSISNQNISTLQSCLKSPLKLIQLLGCRPTLWSRHFRGPRVVLFCTKISSQERQRIAILILGALLECRIGEVSYRQILENMVTSFAGTKVDTIRSVRIF